MFPYFCGHHRFARGIVPKRWQKCEVVLFLTNRIVEITYSRSAGLVVRHLIGNKWRGYA